MAGGSGGGAVLHSSAEMTTQDVKDTIPHVERTTTITANNTKKADTAAKWLTGPAS
jgi:hypothetical protein